MSQFLLSHFVFQSVFSAAKELKGKFLPGYVNSKASVERIMSMVVGTKRITILILVRNASVLWPGWLSV